MPTIYSGSFIFLVLLISLEEFGVQISVDESYLIVHYFIARS